MRHIDITINEYMFLRNRRSSEPTVLLSLHVVKQCKISNTSAERLEEWGVAEATHRGKPLNNQSFLSSPAQFPASCCQKHTAGLQLLHRPLTQAADPAHPADTGQL